MNGYERNWSEALSGATVAITGGGGLVGSRIAAQLRTSGARVISVGKLDAYPSDVYGDLFGVRASDPDVVVGDIADADLMADVVSRSDYVIHAAAVADVAACTRNPMAAVQTNIKGTQVLLDTVARKNDRIRRFVFVSSAAVYGNGDPKRMDIQAWPENQPLSPLSVYANSKLWGEHQTSLVLGKANVAHTTVRYFSVYGEPQTVKQGSHSWVVAWLAMRAKLGLPMQLNGGGHQVRDLTHVDDIATATILSMIAPGARGKVLNLGTGRGTSIREVAERIKAYFPDAPIVTTPLPEGDPLGGYADTQQMSAALGWEPMISVEVGIERYVAWLNATPSALPLWLREEAAQDGAGAA